MEGKKGRGMGGGMAEEGWRFGRNWKREEGRERNQGKGQGRNTPLFLLTLPDINPS